MSATPSSAEKKRSFRDLTKENVEFVDGKACCNIGGGGQVKRCRYYQEKYEPGNMVRHFRSRHVQIAKEKGFFREDAEAPEERPPRPPKKIQVAINRQIVSSACARLVTVNNLPLSAIDWPAMQDILKPLADAMHAESFSTHNTRCLLNSAAERIRGKMADEMRGKLICIKIDGASRHGRHIIGINAQFRPREGGDIVIRTLGMVEVREKQTGKFLKSKILEILAKYEIGVERIFCVTCDNGANMLATVRELRKEFEIILNGEASDNEDDEADEQAAWTILRSVLPEFQESVNLVRCGVHTLQLAVNDVTKRHDQHIRRISEVAKHCRKVVYAHNFEQRPLPPLPPRNL
ncbi:uncharacterized protein LOC120429489 [Culex pipiens pallens]|uniref:uncharacterized protein LOC120429489 n=1 Tax=Culex pipiens pallens TaxID=42434 RepID=UPI001954E453|nr:uncharacterized protein LOC120429489 [Culex pipiens pallens]